MGKCEWKEDTNRTIGDPNILRFYPCEDFIPVSMFYTETNYYGVSCNICGADIRKPEPEPEEKPLIEKSGETWAAHWEGVDYLYSHSKTIDIHRAKESFHYCIEAGKYPPMWLSFDEIEKEGLTDEIAKLRPMVIYQKTQIKCTLFGINDEGKAITSLGGVWDFREHFQLATPHELQDA